MFDWARGQVLAKLLENKVWRADWNGANAQWLKNWSTSWFLAHVDFRPGLKVLDVGSAFPLVAQHLHDAYGCEAHAMDAPPDQAHASHFGLQDDYRSRFPNIPMHYCLAGEDKLDPETFDVVICISAIEHTYDSRSPVNPAAPLLHVEALRDMCRMLKPGGLLLFNWDTYLDGVSHHFGWDYLSDIWLLKQAGMVMVDPAQPPRGPHIIYNDPDSLFFSPEAMASFDLAVLPHGASINAIMMKPGAEPRTGLRTLSGEAISPAAAEPISTDEMEQRFRSYRRNAIAALS